MQWKLEAEIEGLRRLTAAVCSSTSALFAWKHENQGSDGWVPGGYIDSILMERLPGSMPLLGLGKKNKEERTELRKALKVAWLYIVDWEDWRESTEKDIWRDTHYIPWNPAWVQSHNYEDMSTWEL
ncbi:hypothetical protein UA08_07708 [Talaromyces atroroseus]|uniref:Uncharacterized protein n=1 Tax=Talaromyces atroroseus TaxID=1441469 RepID=A0A225AQF1_TALAT|nr:hypothetical protein UA08_07708 [Talaromyces atroroseus]OKL57166.1 hypothetical protein UA08_07708 [Talaromyces atroroseus]